MSRHYAIPYMGSKQKLVDKIVPFVLNRHPGTTHFYDLFGGGGSVSLYAVRKYPKLQVHYNELSIAISNLMQYLKEGGEVPFGFVTREEFIKKYAGNDWYAGLLQTCWTFGNNQKTYLYGLPIQDFKQELSMLVMTGTADIEFIERTADDLNKKRYNKNVSTKIFLNPRRYTTPYQRRIVLARQIESFGMLEHMARLESIAKIGNMPGLKDLNITGGLTYAAVEIKGERPVVYCDPPYEDTAEYREGGFDHKTFYDWCMAQNFPVYVSSYKVTDPRFTLVKAINTRSLYRSNLVNNYNYEKIYWNGVQ